MYFLLHLAPYYSGINSTNAHYTNARGQYVFTAEQSGRFYLELNLTANPPAINCNLTKNGITLPYGNTILTPNSVEIQNVQNSDSANYVISCSNLMGSVQFPFRLNVIGEIYLLKLIVKVTAICQQVANTLFT